MCLVKGQVLTFDAVFAFLILVSSILVLGLIRTNASPLDDLFLERKGTDFVRFLYLEKQEEMVLGIGEYDLREGLRKVGVNGVFVEDSDFVVATGERPVHFNTKYLLVPVFNSTDFRVVRLDVW